MSVVDFLRRTPALAAASPEDIDRMASLASVKKLQRGAFVWRAGDIPLSLAVVRSGLIKLSRTSANGRTHLCGLFGAPESIGDLVLLRGAPYPASAIVATTTACVVSVPRELLLTAIARRPEVVESLTSSIHKKLLALHDKIEILGAGSVEARLATALLKLHADLGDELDDGSSIITVALSRRELAELVSTSFETAVRTMSRWEREGVLRTHTNGFTLYDKARLEAIAGLSVSSPFAREA